MSSSCSVGNHIHKRLILFYFTLLLLLLLPLFWCICSVPIHSLVDVFNFQGNRIFLFLHQHHQRQRLAVAIIFSLSLGVWKMYQNVKSACNLLFSICSTYILLTEVKWSTWHFFSHTFKGMTQAPHSKT